MPVLIRLPCRCTLLGGGHWLRCHWHRLTATTPQPSAPAPYPTLPAGGGWFFMPAGLAAALEGLR